MRLRRRIDMHVCMHRFVGTDGGAVTDIGDVIAKLHADVGRCFQASICQQSDADDLLLSVPSQELVEISIRSESCRGSRHEPRSMRLVVRLRVASKRHRCNVK